MPGFLTRWLVVSGLLASSSLKLDRPVPAPRKPTAGRRRVVTREVTFRSGDVVLSGTVHLPLGQTGLPAVVLVHGSGPGLRASTRAEAEAFARAGIVALSYDKRSEGYSALKRDYGLLAEDALSALRLLRGLPETDASRVGLWGFSEGGWVAPLAATLSDDVAFVVTVGANGRQPSRQEAWAMESYLRRHGLRSSMVKAVSETGMRQIVAAGIFPEAHYDTVPVLERVRQPILAIWGELDRLTPPAESLEIFRDALAHTSATLRIVSGAQHGLRRTTDGYDKGTEFAPGYVDLVTSWITGLPESARASSADEPPEQDVRSRPVSSPAWWESGPVQAGVAGVLGIAFLGHLVASFRGKSSGRGAGRLASVLGSSAVLGWLGYFFKLTTSENPRLGPVVAGRTVPWIALQGAAAGTVAATAVTAVRGRRELSSPRRSVRLRMRLVVFGCAVFVPWAIYWGLLLP